MILKLAVVKHNLSLVNKVVLLRPAHTRAQKQYSLKIRHESHTLQSAKGSWRRWMINWSHPTNNNHRLACKSTWFPHATTITSAASPTKNQVILLTHTKHVKLLHEPESGSNLKADLT
ncbi:hypothetical protein KC19_2G247900, partial [Ceratodon purpureus]